MTDEPEDEPQQGLPVQMEIELPSAIEAGVFADFANVWHTPATFVLDFLSIKRPPTPVEDVEGNKSALVPAVVAARVRIPPEQIFPLINALQAQSQQWLAETGRSTPPESWLPETPTV
jgi:hypothetical protein